MSSRPSRGAARLAAILDALPDALVLVNANGTVVNANTIALDAFETPGTALVGRGLLDLLPEFDSRLIPGSMRRPDDSLQPGVRTKPTRMIARRTDGSEFPVEVTSANLENGGQAHDGHSPAYTGDELLMLVVRDLTGTVDTEAELARSQRQTEMILRAAAEGVVGTDTDGRVVLVNPAAAQILGYRASDLGGRELHELILHSRPDGTPFPYDESPLADTLRSGRKHRVRGQVLWSRGGDKVPVDLTTAPVRDGDQLVGAVMTFTDRRPFDNLVKEREDAEKRHEEELEKLSEEHASELTSLRQQHVGQVEELTESHAEEIRKLTEAHAEEVRELTGTGAEKVRELTERLEEATADAEERYASLAEREKDRYDELAARHEQLLMLLGGSLRGPLDELRRELSVLAADDAGQLWPEANQVLHHLSAGYSRITQLIDNVLGYQSLAAGGEELHRAKVMLDAVVAAGIDGAVELIGPGRVQFAVHAPPIEAEVDPQRLATALAHLVADVAGVDATGNAPVSTGGYMDNTVVVAAAQRGEVVRIEVRGPYSGGDPVHGPVVQGIVRAHGGVLQTHEVPGMSGSAFVLEVPLGTGAGVVEAPAPTPAAAAPEAAPAAEATSAGGGGRRRARRSSVDSFLDDAPRPDATADTPADAASPDAAVPAAEQAPAAAPTGRRRRRAAAAEEDSVDVALPAQQPAGAQEPATAAPAAAGTGRRRRGRPSPEETGAAVERTGQPGAMAQSLPTGAVVTAAEHAAGAAANAVGLGGTVPPQGVPVPAGGRAPEAQGAASPAALPAGADAGRDVQAQAAQPSGRRRRAMAAAEARAAAQEAAPRSPFALPPADADRATDGAGSDLAGASGAGVAGAGAAGAGAPGAGAAQGVAQPGLQAVPQPGLQAVPQPGPQAAPLGAAPQVPPQVPQGGAQSGTQPVPQPGTQPVPQPGMQPVPLPGAAPQPGAVAQHGVVPQSGVVPQPQPVPGQPGMQPVPQPGAAPQAVPLGLPAAGQQAPVPAQGTAPAAAAAQPVPAQQPAPGQPVTVPAQQPIAVQPVPAQAATVPPQGGPQDGPQPVPAQAPAGAAMAQVPGPAPVWPGAAVPGAPTPQAPQAAPAPQQPAPGATPVAPQGTAAPVQPPAPGTGTTLPQAQAPVQAQAAQPVPPPQPRLAQPLPAESTATPPPAPAQPQAQPSAPSPSPAPSPTQPPASAAPVAPVAPAVTPPGDSTNSTQGRAFSVRTLGQGVPFARRPGQGQQTPPPVNPASNGRRRKLGTRAAEAEPTATPAPGTPSAAPGSPAGGVPALPPVPSVGLPRPPAPAPRPGALPDNSVGRSYAIGAPDADAAEGPEPLDGPGGAVEVSDQPQPRPMDDELPPEPLDNPRRLLVWPAPDPTTRQALSDRGYRPVVVNSREEVDAQIAAFPAALFVDPLTGPITRTALQSLREAAVAAEVPVMVTAGLAHAPREEAYGADPAVLFKALAPRDSDQHPPRVLLIEGRDEVALAMTASLERRGMQVGRAVDDGQAAAVAAQMLPNLVVMDLMRMDRRRAGILDWLRASGRLSRTPLVVYTAPVEPHALPSLASGESVLFLAERSTEDEVQDRLVDLLARIGTN